MLGEVSRGSRALVLCANISGMPYDADPADRLREACGLANAIGVVIVDAQVVQIRLVRARTLFGKGQIEQFRSVCEVSEVDLVIVDGELSPLQQRNLEEALKRKVIDRTGLILEIFGERAASAEGRLQVELAHLDYQQSRLVRSWTHLERQRGGFGFLGGPGETQIEADRRMIRRRMSRLRKELEQVRKTRALHRSRRGRAPWPTIALVGYTNAGKSTLFNQLTGSDVLAEDLLFATLDPTMRSIKLPGIGKAIVSDTVGFISGLPTQLVAAFRATLEEVIGADVIIHVRDMANITNEAQKRQVLSVLQDLGVIGAAGKKSEIPILELWNKMDLVSERRALELHELAKGHENAVPVSAFTGDGMTNLFEQISNILTGSTKVIEVKVPASDGQKIAFLYEHGRVLAEHETMDDDLGPIRTFSVRLSPKYLGRFSQL